MSAVQKAICRGREDVALSAVATLLRDALAAHRTRRLRGRRGPKCRGVFRFVHGMISPDLGIGNAAHLLYMHV